MNGLAWLGVFLLLLWLLLRPVALENAFIFLAVLLAAVAAAFATVDAAMEDLTGDGALEQLRRRRGRRWPPS